MIFKNIHNNLYYKYFNNCSIKHEKSLSHSARCVVRIIIIVLACARTAPSGAEGTPQGAPFINLLLKNPFSSTF